MDILTATTPSGLWAAAVLLVGLALLIAGLGMVWRLRGQARSMRVVEQALAGRDPARAALPADESQPAGRLAALAQSTDALGKRLSEGRLAESLLPDEDNKLIELAGYAKPAHARARYVVLRFGLALALPMAAVLARRAWLGPGSMMALVFTLFIGFAVGYLLPKWMLVRRVKARKKQAGKELPLLVDLLRLLQGVGLSVDQSLSVIVNDFTPVLPVLGHEFGVSTAVYARGRTREQSLARLSQGFDDDDLAAICRLLVQVDRHGGAVQEPLNRFAQRIRDKRRFELKEKIGRLTVKMTGVMIVTLLPALLIVTGGMGILSVLRGLSRIAGGM
ncbi:type II secretion system F family protein [Bordetella petrii]|uniref:Flp pilus assembly protein n=1 Tax=Bordetella petrii (strain ATCC BAA-461 / DSM 12804 / CCUG 43448 / CIP 107267 / Se-1111R) TaxID=340100 RepID=A9HX59_BORPD|nr:type II secretion system F family protein [Bordetella petrii]CAP43717.1 putative Flp pilus assembly protein [Bordetella petrii]